MKFTEGLGYPYYSDDYLDNLRKRYLNSLWGISAYGAASVPYSKGTAVVRTDTDKDVSNDKLKGLRIKKTIVDEWLSGGKIDSDYIKFDATVTEEVYKKIKEGEKKFMEGLGYYNSVLDLNKMVKKIIRSGKVTVFIWSNGQKDVYRLKDGDEDNFESLFYLAYFRHVNQISGSRAKKLVKKLESKIERH